MNSGFYFSAWNYCCLRQDWERWRGKTPLPRRRCWLWKFAFLPWACGCVRNANSAEQKIRLHFIKVARNRFDLWRRAAKIRRLRSTLSRELLRRPPGTRWEKDMKPKALMFFTIIIMQFFVSFFLMVSYHINIKSPLERFHPPCNFIFCLHWLATMAQIKRQKGVWEDAIFLGRSLSFEKFN